MSEGALPPAPVEQVATGVSAAWIARRRLRRRSGWFKSPTPDFYSRKGWPLPAAAIQPNRVVAAGHASATEEVMPVAWRIR